MEKTDEEIKLRAAVERTIVDSDFRTRFLADPKSVLAEVGIIYPPDLKVIAIELPYGTIGIPVPPMKTSK